MKNRYIGLLVVAVFALACAGVVIITVLWPEPAFVPKAGAPPPTLFFSSPAPPAPFPTNAMVDTRSAAIILKGDFDAIMHLVVNRIQPPPTIHTNEHFVIYESVFGTITDTNVRWFQLVSPEAVTLMTVGVPTTAGHEYHEYRFAKTNGQWFFKGGGFGATVYYGLKSPEAL